MKEQIEILNKVYDDVVAELKSNVSLKDIESVRSKYLGIGGVMSSMYKTLGLYNEIDRKSLGEYLHFTKRQIETEIKNKRENIMNNILTSSTETI